MADLHPHIPIPTVADLPRTDISGAFTKRLGARLPHWRVDGATYAVTFRLGDSIAADVLKRWRIEREQIVLRAEQMERPLTTVEIARLDHLYGVRIQRWLDQGHGACVLRQPAIAQLVRDAILHFDGDRYSVLVWCVMPNHAHVVLRPHLGFKLSRILMSWKGFTGKKALELLGKIGEGGFWQPESYDHIVRGPIDLVRQVRYVLKNPCKARLANWPWVGFGSGIPKETQEQLWLRERAVAEHSTCDRQQLAAASGGSPMVRKP